MNHDGILSGIVSSSKDVIGQRMNTFYDSKHFLSVSDEPGEEIRQLTESLAYSTLGVIADSNVPLDGLTRELFPGAVFVERLEGGEGCKTLPAVTRFVEAHQCVLDRNSLVIVIGGGAVLDIVGLCCGLMYRGIRYVSVPTTLIAMTDAAYGGKTAVNLGGKNQIGMYHHPEMVYVNPIFLRSLPDVHVASGMVEIAKLAIFFDDIRLALDDIRPGNETLTNVIILAARRKLELLERDPFEDNAASVLLYGHPFGNAFETFACNRNGYHVPHGFAVALGISFSAWLSEQLNEPTGRHVKEFDLLSRWIDLAALAKDMTPSNCNEMLILLARDKYAIGESIRVPAMSDHGGYTTVPLERVAVEYDAWRSWLLSNDIATADMRCDGAAKSEGTSAYIAGRPTDETIAPLRFSSADGPFIITTAGKRILDWSTCLNAPFGHSQRLDTSMLPVNSGNYPTEPRDTLVNRLRCIFTFMSGFQFRSSGTESVEAGLRYVLAALGSSAHTVSIEGCYHGLTMGARSLMGSGDAIFRHTVLPFAMLQDSRSTALKLESLMQAGPIAVWLEGVQGATLRRLPAVFLDVLQNLRDRFPGNVALVCDDMLASIRCGDWCSISSALDPDVIIAGKSWANGYPFSFFGVAPWIRSTAGDILGTTSYGGNPIACANAVYTIARIEDAEILEHIRGCESEYEPVLASGVGGKASVVRSEWHGLLFGFEMVDTETALHTARSAANAGLLVSQIGPVIRCTPQIDISGDLLDRGLNILIKAIDANG